MLSVFSFLQQYNLNNFVIYGIVIYILYTYIKKSILESKYDIHKIPSPPSYPIVGHVHHFFSFDKPKLPTWIYNWYQKLGQPPVMLVDLMYSKMVILNDSSFIQEKLFTHNGYEKAKAQYYPLKNLIDDKKPAHTLLTTTKTNPTWKAIRQAVSASFSTKALKQIFPINLACLCRFEEIILRQNEPFEGQISFFMLALDVITRAGFEYEFDTYNKGKQLILSSAKSFSNALIKRDLYIIRLLCKLFPMSSFGKKYRETMDSARNVAEEVLMAYKAQEKEIDENNLSIIANLSRVIDPETGKKLSDFKLVSEIATLLFAGFATIGSQLSWIFVILSFYPECEVEILKEFKEHNIIGENSRNIEYNDILRLKYLNAFFKECMRMATAVLFADHMELPHDEIVCGYWLPKGTTISVLNRSNHMTKSTWENPKDFMPERWLTGHSSSLEKKLSSFSRGTRSCVGMQLATNEILTTLIFLISKYEIKFINIEKKTLNDLMNESLYWGVMMYENGLYFEHKKREVE